MNHVAQLTKPKLYSEGVVQEVLKVNELDIAYFKLKEYVNGTLALANPESKIETLDLVHLVHEFLDSRIDPKSSEEIAERNLRDSVKKEKWPKHVKDEVLSVAISAQSSIQKSVQLLEALNAAESAKQKR